MWKIFSKIADEDSSFVLLEFRSK